MRIDRVSFCCECGEEFEASVFDNVVSFDCPNCNQERMFGLIVDDYKELPLSDFWSDDSSPKPKEMSVIFSSLIAFLASLFVSFLLLRGMKKQEPIHTELEGNTFSNVESTDDRPLIEVRP